MTVIRKESYQYSLWKRVFIFIAVILSILSVLGGGIIFSALHFKREVAHIYHHHIILQDHLRQLERLTLSLSVEYENLLLDDHYHNLSTLRKIERIEKDIEVEINFVKHELNRLESGHNIKESKLAIRNLISSIELLKELHEQVAIRALRSDSNVTLYKTQLLKAKKLFQRSMMALSNAGYQMIKKDVGETTHSVDLLYVIMLATLLFSVVIVIVATRWLVISSRNLILSPLTQFRMLVRKLAKGDFTGEIELAGSKEMREFAQEFNRMKTQLAAYQQRIQSYKQALDQVALVAVVDLDGYFVEVNENFVQALGHSLEELQQQNYKWSFSLKDKDILKELLVQLEYGLSWQGELEHCRLDGSSLWTETIIVPLFSLQQSGIIEKRMVISFDITKRRQQAEVIKQQQEQLMISSRLQALGDLASGIAHEINNPLVVINSTASVLRKLLQKDSIDQKRVELFLSDIEKMVKRITTIIGGLRSLANSESSGESSYLANVFEQLLSIYQINLKRAKVELTMEGLDSAVKAVQISAGELTQVMLTLFSNSVEAMQEAKIEQPWIRVEISEKEDFTRLRIIDAGSGVTEEIAQKMFDPFFTTKKIGHSVGAGLGLGVARRVVEQLGGALFYDSSCANTCFVIDLPHEQVVSIAV